MRNAFYDQNSTRNGSDRSDIFENSKWTSGFGRHKLSESRLQVQNDMWFEKFFMYK